MNAQALGDDEVGERQVGLGVRQRLDRQRLLDREVIEHRRASDAERHAQQRGRLASGGQRRSRIGCGAGRQLVQQHAQL